LLLRTNVGKLHIKRKRRERLRMAAAHERPRVQQVPHISVRNLSVRYRAKDSSVLALDDISIDIPPKSFVSFVGPSGCGKTTLLKVLSGVLKPSSGDVLFDGCPLAGAQLSGRIGHVFQRPLLLPWRTALENVALTLEVARKDLARDERLSEARRWLSLTGLKEFEHRLPHELSGGMQQRVSISRALAFHPSILMMDEPFAALDEITREAMQEELLRLWSVTEGSVIFVTHSISEAVLLSERIVVMTARPGKVEEIIEIPFGRPRDEELRGSAAFTKLVQHIRHKLRHEPSAGRH
jgi:NitT/TauT family transport system ATP-binding protein